MSWPSHGNITSSQSSFTESAQVHIWIYKIRFR